MIPKSRRILLPGLFLAILLGGISATSQALDMDALVGFGQASSTSAHYRTDTLTPLTIFLGNVNTSGVAQLQVRLQTNNHSILYTRPVTLRAGAQNEPQRFTLDLRSNTALYMGARGGTNDDISVQLLMDGRKLAEKHVVLPLAADAFTYNVLALTRDGSGLNFLTRKHLGLIHRFVNPANAQGAYGNVQTGGDLENININSLPTSQILYTDPQALPDMAQGYAMIDVIALADLPLDSLTEDQSEALKQYVREGGLMIVSGGGDLARLKGQFFSDLLPVLPSGARNESDLPALTKRYQRPLPLSGPVTLTQGSLKPNAYSLFPESRPAPGALPLVSALPYGAGVVVFTSFDYLAPEFRSWKGAPGFWRDLLRCGDNAISPRNVLALNSQYDNASQQLADALAGKQATNVPAFTTVAGFVTAYILLLVPVSYIVLKKLDKREMAWFTAPVLILVFSVISYLIAQSIKGGRITVNRAVILETQENSDQAGGYAQMTLYSPRRAHYDITFAAPDDQNASYRNLLPGEIFQTGMESPNSELTIDQDKTTTIRGALIRLWDKRSFDTPVPASLGGPIEVRTKMVENGKALVTITNKTRYALRDCALLNNDRSVSLGNLAPGETREARLLWSANYGVNHIAQLPTTPLMPESSVDSNRMEDTPIIARNKIQQAMLQTLGVNAPENYGNITTGDYGSGDNAFEGWFDDPLLHVHVDGQPTAGEEVNMLYVHLRTPVDGPVKARKIADPFADAPLLNPQEEPLTQRGGIFK